MTATLRETVMSSVSRLCHERRERQQPGYPIWTTCDASNLQVQRLHRRFPQPVAPTMIRNAIRVSVKLPSMRRLTCSPGIRTYHQRQRSLVIAPTLSLTHPLSSLGYLSPCWQHR
jgi:hypothetical protein